MRCGAVGPCRAQVVGWPPVRNYRKNTLAASAPKSKAPAEDAASGGGPMYVKVSMDGAPYLRKVDIKMYSSYEDLSAALEKMFSCFITGESCAAALSFSLMRSPLSIMQLLLQSLPFLGSVLTGSVV